ncbi:hypothetical protein L228DRAFT_247709 [Xylona heveae TC161]|uniref:N-acetyltransferase domain-containing protein n=1 Tax=Xylona heveae (strain CBS 132557 / TC161) TaxID=1328760 RepID=A0A165GEE5_XYLHT|nr:hypothetical protein L228DRAFT_247709 [Xylona heveae TC161]KZF22090.1 hypothetical protein L228DRAFT_247709 [Xylona heveae TC161]
MVEKLPSLKLQLQGPLSNLRDGYIPHLPSSQQATHINRIFLDGPEVREEVFVKEQGVPQRYVSDADDARCCHWVAYATREAEEDGRAIIPIGTVRLLPFPHLPHPLPGAKYPEIDCEGNFLPSPPEVPVSVADRATTLHDGVEPYIKLGRLAVRQEFRGKGVARALVVAALEWARQHPSFFNSLVTKALSKDPSPQNGENNQAENFAWRGLVYVHAQSKVIPAWTSYGFTIDEGMGTWHEVNIPHVGMVFRLELEG